MKEEIMLAGFGGQGVLFSGQLLGKAAVLEEKEVSFVPTYGPEMRGGLSSCGVVISNRAISCPLITEPTAAIAFNQSSLDALEPLVQPGGCLIFNSSLVDRKPERRDLTVMGLPANELAAEIGIPQAANMVLLGALVEATGIVDRESLLSALQEGLPEAKHNLLPLNREALAKGASLARPKGKRVG